MADTDGQIADSAFDYVGDRHICPDHIAETFVTRSRNGVKRRTLNFTVLPGHDASERRTTKNRRSLNGFRLAQDLPKGAKTAHTHKGPGQSG